MGDPAPAKVKKVAVKPIKRTAFDWYERKLVAAGVATTVSAVHAERIFFLPELDSTIPIAEGPTPADWKGYHAGKHGVYERFANLKGESLNMGELFFKEKYRWVNSDFLKGPNELATFTEAKFNALLDEAYKNAPRQTRDLSGFFDTEKFTKDVKALFDKHKGSPRSTVWQARYIYRNASGPTGELGQLQTNVDFEFEGSKYRVAVDAKTGKALNFFRIEQSPKFGPMKFAEIVLRWKGRVTDVTVHQVPGATIKIEVAATWPKLLIQGVKSGAAGGAAVSGFLGAIDGFKKEGLVGGLKGLSIGVLGGAVIGGGIGGVVTLASRIWPWVGKVAKVAGFVGTVVAILLDASETGLDPQEFGSSTKDDEGNIWRYRHVIKKGSILFPESEPKGVLVKCPDGTIVEFGEDEFGVESSYRHTPITVYARSKRVNWHSIKTPDGSSMWWWQDLSTKEEFLVVYEDGETMMKQLAREKEEAGFRFVVTQN